MNDLERLEYRVEVLENTVTHLESVIEDLKEVANSAVEWHLIKEEKGYCGVESDILARFSTRWMAENFVDSCRKKSDPYNFYKGSMLAYISPAKIAIVARTKSFEYSEYVLNPKPFVKD